MNAQQQQPTRRNFLRLTGAMGLAAGIAAGVSACAGQDGTSSASSSGGGSAKEDGAIKAAISYELGTNGFDPMTTTAALTIAVNWHTLEGLTEIDPATFVETAREPGAGFVWVTYERKT